VAEIISNCLNIFVSKNIRNKKEAKIKKSGMVKKYQKSFFLKLWPKNWRTVRKIIITEIATHSKISLGFNKVSSKSSRIRKLEKSGNILSKINIMI
jgi:hypothetical protein